MSVAETVFALLLRAYPASFRAAYAHEMSLVFRDMRRVHRGSDARFWAAIVWDVVRSAPAQRLQRSRELFSRNNQTGEGTIMKTMMAILAILIGAIEMVNALVEGRAAGMANLDGSAFLALTMVVVAGVLLLASGIALLRDWAAAVGLSQAAAVTCLAAFALVFRLNPTLSIFANILGIGFPIALLFFLRSNRGRGSRAPTMA
ncbi:MAG: hypothetical protein JWM95_1399 [Gemmatimonadetes bacterium]|nr:hypothetical protein [Gemmatimonadota bacterium]